MVCFILENVIILLFKNLNLFWICLVVILNFFTGLYGYRPLGLLVVRLQYLLTVEWLMFCSIAVFLRLLVRFKASFSLLCCLLVKFRQFRALSDGFSLLIQRFTTFLSSLVSFE